MPRRADSNVHMESSLCTADEVLGAWDWLLVSMWMSCAALITFDPCPQALAWEHVREESVYPEFLSTPLMGIRLAKGLMISRGWSFMTCL